MLLALSLWLRYPTELEADLTFRHIDIGAWHRLDRDAHGVPVLSSRRLLVLAEHLPDNSAFKIAVNCTGWSVSQHIAATTANDLMDMHVISHVAHGGEWYETTHFRPPLVIAMEEADEEFLDDARDDLMAQLDGEG